MPARQSLSSRPGKAAALAALGGLLLLISLFVPWAQIVCVLEPCELETGWEVMRYLDIPIAVLALVSIALGLLGLVRPVVAAGALIALAGTAALVLVFLAPILEDRGMQPVDFGGWYHLAVVAGFATLAGGLALYGLVKSSESGAEG